MNELKQRMYHLTMYNISPIQQGIQSYHSAIEYSLVYGSSEEYKRWAIHDKTVIILNGGTSNETGISKYDFSASIIPSQGTMEKNYKELLDANIKCAPFYEPDLNNSLSAIAFLVDERVWDKEKYPDPIISSLPALHAPDRNLYAEAVKEQLEKEYGKEIAFLRSWLSKFRLA